MKLKRSNDRKVANAVSKNGKTPTIANTFGLPSGKAYSCPGETSVCSKVCYAGKLEKVYKGVRETLLHNWNLLKDADHDTMESLLQEMIDDFKKDCDKRNAEKLFRIHWDGDFFSDEYAFVWKHIVLNNPDVQFWVYTRVASAANILKGMDNLSLYFSADSENIKTAVELKQKHGIRMAYLAQNFAAGQETMKQLISKPGAKCPENAKRIPLISTNGSACVTCGLCVYNKADIVFSATKK